MAVLLVFYVGTIDYFSFLLVCADVAKHTGGINKINLQIHKIKIHVTIIIPEDHWS